MELAILSAGELKAAIATAVKNGVSAALIRAVPEAVRLAKLPEYIRQPQLKELTGLSDRKIQYLKAKRRIPYIKQGRAVLYRTADVLRWLEEGRVPAKPQKKECGRRSVGR